VVFAVFLFESIWHDFLMHETHSGPGPDIRPSVYWLIQSLADVPKDDSWLSEREQTIASRMYFEKRRQDWRLGRWTAKRAIMSRLGLPLDMEQSSKLEIIAAADGAPEAFVDGLPAPISLSISHSGGIGFCAVANAGCALGCDLEEVRLREGSFASDYFGADELCIVDSAAPADRLLLINLIWSAKESALKAMRQGLRLDTRSIRVLPLDMKEGGWNRLEIVENESSRNFCGWWQERGGRICTIAAGHTIEAPAEIRLPSNSP
jgi:4'-phosphopantetheinyl transferase